MLLNLTQLMVHYFQICKSRQMLVKFHDCKALLQILNARRDCNSISNFLKDFAKHIFLCLYYSNAIETDTLLCSILPLQLWMRLLSPNIKNQTPAPWEINFTLLLLYLLQTWHLCQLFSQSMYESIWCQHDYSHH